MNGAYLRPPVRVALMGLGRSMFTEHYPVFKAHPALFKVVAACETPSYFMPVYPDNATVKEKIELIAKNIYRASKVNYTPQANKAIAEVQKLGADDLPVCIAKTQYSLSDDPTLLGAPKDFEITVRNVSLSNGAA